MLARDRLSLRQMSWILVKVFFGYGGENAPVIERQLTDRARQIECAGLRALFLIG